MYLLDTNIVIYFLEGKLPPRAKAIVSNIVDISPNISIITKMEALGFNFPKSDEQETMENFVAGSVILNLNDTIVNKTIAIRKLKKIALPDAIIAATAIVNDFILVTRNTTDFSNLEGLTLLNPWEV